MLTQNIFQSLPDNLENEVFESLVQNDNLRIERIISNGHRSPESGWYDQADNEWVILLKGEAMLSFEQGDDVHLKPGDYLNIPAHCKHKVSWSKTETIWLAVHY